MAKKKEYVELFSRLGETPVVTEEDLFYVEVMEIVLTRKNQES